MKRARKTVGIIAQARMGSTRLPGKVLMKIKNDTTILDSVIEQLRHCKKVDRIIIATTNLPEDDVIKEECKKFGISCFRGNQNDVLDRYFQCAKKYSLDVIVRITCDNPLIDPQLIDKMITRFNIDKWDFGTNCFPRTFPYGTEIEIFSFKSLKNIWKVAKTKEQKEHVTKYFYENPEKFKIFNLKNKDDESHYRYTVDTSDDLERVKKIIFGIKNRPITTDQIVKILSE